jgi:hypothetical protein
MTDQKETTKKISRRDALKLLGAAIGASIVANLPAKWVKPESISGVLPVHAQTSLPVTSTTTATPTVTATNNPLTSTNTPTSTPTPTQTLTSTSTSTPTQTLTSTSTSTATATPALPIVQTDSITDQSSTSLFMDFSGQVLSDGGSPVTVRGFVWSTNPNPTLADNVVPNGSGLGAYTSTNVITPNGTIHVRAYATNLAGTAFGADLSAANVICLAEGMLITLADGLTKKIEDIKYSDSLLVWNFDEGKFDAACPLWIKKTEVTNEYNLLEFSDGSLLKTVNQHRIFNKELGAFTYPMTEDTPVGTTTFNASGAEVILIHKSVVKEQVNYYNVITNEHMNLFANGILTSCRYNNIYPISEMKFVKDERALTSREEYGLEEKYYAGLRLAEQTFPVAETIAYVERLKARQLETELVPAGD